jgi:hypothetical protein
VINRELKMSEPLQIAVLSSIATLLVSWGSVYLAHYFQLTRDIRLRDREVRSRLFATLMGQKLVLAQLYVSQSEAFIISDYYEYRWRLTGRQEHSIDFQEATRWMHKSEELVLEIARGNRGLFEAVASARTSFPDAKELDTLTEAVYRHKTPRIVVRPNDQMTLAQLDEWKAAATRQVQELVCEAVEKPIDDLVEYLAPRVRAD